MSLPDSSHSTCLYSWEEVAGPPFPGTGWLATDPTHRVLHMSGCKDSFAPSENCSESCSAVYSLCHLHHPGRAGFHWRDQQGFLPICPFAFLLGESQATGTKSSPSIWLCSQVSLETRPASFHDMCASAEHWRLLWFYVTCDQLIRNQACSDSLGPLRQGDISAR